MVIDGQVGDQIGQDGAYREDRMERVTFEAGESVAQGTGGGSASAEDETAGKVEAKKEREEEGEAGEAAECGEGLAENTEEDTWCV